MENRRSSCKSSSSRTATPFRWSRKSSRPSRPIAPKLPRDLHISNWYDQSELILGSANSVFEAVLIGIALAGLVLLAFLRNIKITVITLIVVPAVLSSTILLLSVLGMSFNIMTLGGMAAAIGLIIDDAIVMIEQIERRLHSKGERGRDEIRAATWEFLKPLAGSSAATIIIFRPAGLPHRRHRGILQVAGADAGLVTDRFIPRRISSLFRCWRIIS